MRSAPRPTSRPNVQSDGVDLTRWEAFTDDERTYLNALEMYAWLPPQEGDMPEPDWEPWDQNGMVADMIGELRLTSVRHGMDDYSPEELDERGRLVDDPRREERIEEIREVQRTRADIEGPSS